jgi:hemerythrin
VRAPYLVASGGAADAEVDDRGMRAESNGKGVSMARGIAIPRMGRLPALGHDAIDSDHSAIANQWARAANCEPIEFPFLIARLKKLMINHFDHEAALMEGAGGNLCRCHRGEHQSLLDLCDQARESSERSWRKTQSLLRNSFPKLVRNHILYTDQLAVLFINTRAGIGHVA